MSRRSLEVPPSRLRRRVDLRALPFGTTAEVEPLTGTIGQPRALDAIEFGLAVETHGFNLFVAGAPGSGRMSTIRDYLDRVAAKRATPDDWVYVYNFAEPDRPNAIRLPAGRGGELGRDMESFVRAARREIPRALESEEYDRRQREISGELERRRELLTDELKTYAREHGYALETTPVGIVTAPVLDGEPLTRERFEQLPEADRERIVKAKGEIEARTSAYARAVHQLGKEAQERIQELEREVALYTVGPLFGELNERYAGLDEVLAYLRDVSEDLLAHLDDFKEEPEQELPFQLPGMAQRRGDLARYRVNVFVDNGALRGAPVVVERNPTYYNLVGRIDYRATFGAMVTDFREIKAGALHRANGGFLVLELSDLLRHPFSWEALKRALRGREVRIENLAEEFSAVPTATLRPEPVPLDVKVVVIGLPLFHHLLYQYDEDFRELFKVKADFAPDMDWSREHFGNYAAFVSRWVREAGLRHFDRGAVARLIEYGARLREDQRKLSTRLIEISDVVSEASFWAGEAGRKVVRAEDVDAAIRKREYRSNLIEERVRELISEGTIMIDAEGAKVGQVNGIAVLELGDYSFGKPSRVTARAALGRGRVESIEREIELSGPIHSKGFLILTGYLAGTYGQERPLALSATITFEQSYDEVEGDSASSTELYALLSALSGLPLDQGIAVTGSVNQHGEVQAVGGVTRKVEGFYATCKAKGLTGRQGVIVPAANVPNLMLDDEVVDAVREGRFHVWAVRTVDEGIALLTGKPARTVHRLVAERLREYAERAESFAVGREDVHRPRQALARPRRRARPV